MKNENEAMAHQLTHLEQRTESIRIGRDPLPGGVSSASRRYPHLDLGSHDGLAYVLGSGQTRAGSAAGSAVEPKSVIDAYPLPRGSRAAWAFTAIIGGIWLITEIVMHTLIAYKWTSMWVTACTCLILWVNGELPKLLSWI